jgi:plastocyanin domain-containing protein
MKKSTTVSIIVSAALIAGVLMFSGGKSSNLKANTQKEVELSNVSIVDGKQIVEIKAKGGYSPNVTLAKSGIPTIIRFETNGTFDCSSSVRIPGMNISKILPQTGSTDIDIGSPLATVQGTCSMGMYHFEVQFKG